MLRAFGVLARLEQSLGDEAGERGDVATLEHGDRLLALEGGDDSASGNGCSSLTEMTPTFLPWLRR